MTPELEKKMNDKLHNASFEELMPGFDKEAEWQMLSRQLAPKRRRMPLRTWAYAATIVALMGAATCWLLLHDSKRSVEMAKIEGPKPGTVPVTTSPGPVVINNDTDPARSVASAVKPVVSQGGNAVHKNKVSEVIRNTTPCPIEICISQTMKCPNERPAAISTYSTLQPSQSVELHYKDDGNIGKNCSVAVKAIEFKSIATGETILLNSSSTITAQEVFSYITGQKKGDVLAGVFSSDCNHKARKHNLKLDNSYGNLTIQ